MSQGRLIGFDLNSVLSQWWRKWSYDIRRFTKFKKIRAKFRLDRGVATTVGPATLRGSAVELDVNGSVSFPKKQIDQRVRARFSPPPSTLPIPMRIRGLWNKPRVSLDLGLFTKRPDWYEVPQSVSVRTRTQGVSASARTRIPLETRERIKRILDDPDKSRKLPAKLRRSLDALVKAGTS